MILIKFRGPMQYILGNELKSLSFRHEYSLPHRIGKYLIHGFVFSIMMLGAEVVLASTLPMLIIFASFLGICIWLGLVFLSWGCINGMLCHWLWRFRAKQHWASLIGHGFVMFLVLLIVELPITALLQLAMANISPGIFVSVQIASLSIIDGIIGKAVGGMFKNSYVPIQRRSSVSWRIPTD